MDRSRFLETLTAAGLEPGHRALAAVSGGPDSVALLDLLAQTRDRHGLDIVVAHVDHGIHPASGLVAARVQALAAEWKFESRVERLDLGPGTSETDARAARYAALERIRLASGARVVMLAHHADDQAETVLLRVLHGSGPAGLAAMDLRQGCLVRPLLSFRREELAQYLRERGLEAWEDPANRDARHLRSWLRHEVLPTLRTRVVGAEEGLVRVADQARLDRAAWDRILDELPALECRLERDGISVAAPVLAAYDSTLAQAVLRAMARRVGFAPGYEAAGRAVTFLRESQSGRRLELGEGWVLELELSRARLRRQVAGAKPPRLQPVELDGWPGGTLVGRWQFQWAKERVPAPAARGGWSAWFVPGVLRIRAWRAGDTIRPLGGRGGRAVVKCFQEARVPRDARRDWPLVVNPAGEVLWVPGICRSDALVPDPGTEGLRVDAHVV